MNRGSVGFLMNEYAESGLREPPRGGAALDHPSAADARARPCTGARRRARAINEVSLWRQTYQAAKMCDQRRRRGAARRTDRRRRAGGDAGRLDRLQSLGQRADRAARRRALMALTPISAFRPRRWRGALLPDRARVTHRGAGGRQAPGRRGRRPFRNPRRRAGRHRDRPRDLADPAARSRPFARRAHPCASSSAPDAGVERRGRKDDPKAWPRACESIAEETLADGRFRLTRTPRRGRGGGRRATHARLTRSTITALPPRCCSTTPTRGVVMLVRQFRLAAYLADGALDMLEACAGMLDGDDAARPARVREAWEETGVRLAAARHAFDAFTSPGALTEKIACFVAPYRAADRIGAGGGVDADEHIEVVEVPLRRGRGDDRDGRDPRRQDDRAHLLRQSEWAVWLSAARSVLRHARAAGRERRKRAGPARRRRADRRRDGTARCRPASPRR